MKRMAASKKEMRTTLDQELGRVVDGTEVRDVALASFHLQHQLLKYIIS